MDNEGLPPGFDPAWTYIKTRDGVVEYEHPAGERVRRAMSESAAADINRLVDEMERDNADASGRFARCRGAGRDLAAAIAALPESDAKTALYPSYEKFMGLDSGNFAPPEPLS